MSFRKVLRVRYLEYLRFYCKNLSVNEIYIKYISRLILFLTHTKLVT